MQGQKQVGADQGLIAGHDPGPGRGAGRQAADHAAQGTFVQGGIVVDGCDAGPGVVVLLPANDQHRAGSFDGQAFQDVVH